MDIVIRIFSFFSFLFVKFLKYIPRDILFDENGDKHIITAFSKIVAWKCNNQFDPAYELIASEHCHNN